MYTSEIDNSFFWYLKSVVYLEFRKLTMSRSMQFFLQNRCQLYLHTGENFNFRIYLTPFEYLLQNAL